MEGNRFKQRWLWEFFVSPDSVRPRQIPASLRRVTYRKVAILFAAAALNDLRVPPGNRLELFAGDRKGQWSIRINDQYRLCFKWEGDHAADIEFCDYH